MEKSGKFSGLLCREWFLSKGAYRSALINCAIMTALGALVLLSCKFGNLSRLPEDTAEVADRVIPMFIYIIPPFMSSLLISSATQTSFHDELTAWKRFRLACPVKPSKFALAKSVLLVISLLAAIAFGFAYVAILRAIEGERLTTADAGYLMTFYTAITAMMVFVQIMIMLLHSLEKAMMALIFPAILIGLGLSMIVGKDGGVEPEEILNTLERFCTGSLPFSPLAIAAILGIQFAAVKALIGRREK